MEMKFQLIAVSVEVITQEPSNAIQRLSTHPYGGTVKRINHTQLMLFGDIQTVLRLKELYQVKNKKNKKIKL